MEELLTVPGAARKTANVVLGPKNETHGDQSLGLGRLVGTESEVAFRAMSSI
jgi:hypothetical protein